MFDVSHSPAPRGAEPAEKPVSEHEFLEVFIIAPGMLTAALCAGAAELGFDTASCSSAGRSLPARFISRRQRFHGGYFASEIHRRSLPATPGAAFGERSSPLASCAWPCLNPDSRHKKLHKHRAKLQVVPLHSTDRRSQPWDLQAAVAGVSFEQNPFQSGSLALVFLKPDFALAPSSPKWLLAPRNCVPWRNTASPRRDPPITHEEVN